MAKHRMTYEDGVATNEPWSLSEYLQVDGFRPIEQDMVIESVTSWLQEYEGAGLSLKDALRDLIPL